MSMSEISDTDRGSSLDSSNNTISDFRQRLQRFKQTLYDDTIDESDSDDENKDLDRSEPQTVSPDPNASASTSTGGPNLNRTAEGRKPRIVFPPECTPSLNRGLKRVEINDPAIDYATPGRNLSLSNLLAPPSGSLARSRSERKIPIYEKPSANPYDHTDPGVKKHGMQRSQSSITPRNQKPRLTVPETHSYTTPKTTPKPVNQPPIHRNLSTKQEYSHTEPSSNNPQFNPNHLIRINGKDYQKLNLLGKGGSSKVWQVFDPDRQLCLAVKVVDLAGAEDEVRKAYENEMHLLKKLQHSDKVVHLFEHENQGGEQVLLMEKGDTDLGKYLKGKQARKEPLPSSIIESYFREMLQCVSVIHKEGIIHSDLKPANFLLVGGNVKLIDFGIASTVPSNKTSVMIECQMGTLSYMSPEAIRNSGFAKSGEPRKLTTKTDIWSLGCILYSMVYGRTPFQHITNQYAKMMAIMGEDASRGRIHFPDHSNPLLLDVIKQCLKRDARDRPTVDEVLDHPYFKEEKEKKAPGGPPLSEEAIRRLAASLPQNSPRTNMRILKQIQSGRGD